MSALEIGALALGGAGTVTNALVQLYGFGAQRRENRRTQALQKEMWERSEKIRQGERREDVAFRGKQFREDTKWKNFQKRQAFLDTVLTQFNTNPTLANNFVAAQRGRQ